MNDDEKKVIADGFLAVAQDMESHKAAIARLAENLAPEHAKLLEQRWKGAGRNSFPPGTG